MIDNDVFALMDQHMEAEYDIADANDLANLENEVRVLSDQVDAQAHQIANLTNHCNGLSSALEVVAELSGHSVKYKIGLSPLMRHTTRSRGPVLMNCEAFA